MKREYNSFLSLFCIRYYIHARLYRETHSVFRFYFHSQYYDDGDDSVVFFLLLFSALEVSFLFVGMDCLYHRIHVFTITTVLLRCFIHIWLAFVA